MAKYLLDIPNDLHKKIKIYSIEKGITIKDIIIYKIREVIAQDVRI